MIFFAGKDDRLQEGDARQIEEWTADSGRWQGRFFSLWGEQTVNESGTNTDRGRRTADRGVDDRRLTVDGGGQAFQIARRGTG